MRYSTERRELAFMITNWVSWLLGERELTSERMTEQPPLWFYGSRAGGLSSDSGETPASDASLRS